MAQLTVNGTWFGFWSAWSLEGTTALPLGCVFLKEGYVKFSLQRGGAWKSCTHKLHCEQGCLLFWWVAQVKLGKNCPVCSAPGHQQEWNCITPMSGWWQRKDVFLYSFLKWLERLQGEREGCVRSVRLPKFCLGILGRKHTGIPLEEEAAAIKDKTEECSGVGQRELVSLWGRAAACCLCSGCLVKPSIDTQSARPTESFWWMCFSAQGTEIDWVGRFVRSDFWLWEMMFFIKLRSICKTVTSWFGCAATVPSDAPLWHGRLLWLSRGAALCPEPSWTRKWEHKGRNSSSHATVWQHSIFELSGMFSF